MKDDTVTETAVLDVGRQVDPSGNGKKTLQQHATAERENELLFSFTSRASGESSHTLSHGNPASSHLHGSKQLFFVLLTDINQSFHVFTFDGMQRSFHEFVNCLVDDHYGSSRHEPFKPQARRVDLASSWRFGFKAPLMTEDADRCVQLRT